jgi:CelD/BcsL family acetyltransferase involved in cellulose biosynthesis
MSDPADGTVEEPSGSPADSTGIQRLEKAYADLGWEIGHRKRAGDRVDELIARHRELSAQLKQLRESVRDPLEVAAMPPDATLCCSIITSNEEFAALRPEWRALFVESQCYSPFMQWEWLFPWWRWFGHGKRLRLITVRDDQQRLVGIAPLMLGLRYSGTLHRATLAFMGTGEEGPRGQYFSIIAHPDRDEEVRVAVADAIASLAREWQAIELWRLADTDQIWRLLSSMTGIPGASVTVRRSASAVHGQISASYDAFLDSVRSANRRRWLRNARESTDEQTITHRTCQSPGDLAAATQLLRHYSIERQTSKGKVSNWSNEADLNCLLEMLQLLWEAGQVRIDLLHVESEPVAVNIGLIWQNTYFLFAPAFAQEHASLSPFHRLMVFTMQDFVRDGVTRYDCLSNHRYQREYFADLTYILEANVITATPLPLISSGFRSIGRGLKSAARRRSRTS